MYQQMSFVFLLVALFSLSQCGKVFYYLTQVSVNVISTLQHTLDVDLRSPDPNQTNRKFYTRPTSGSQVNQLAHNSCQTHRSRCSQTFFTYLVVIVIAGPARDSRVIGGQNADVGEYPWMAELFYFDLPSCGGTLVSERFVLTAAQCVDGVRP